VVHTNRVRAVTFCSSLTCLLLAMLLTASRVLATTYDCTTCNLNSGYYYCYAGQQSLNTDFTGIDGYVTDPSASDLPGNSGNNYLSDHIALWNGITEFNASYCGGTCWIQAGLIMGTAGGKYYYGGTGQFEAYFENMGPTYQIVFKTHSEIPISPGSSYEVKVEYDGGVGADNQPQFRTYVNGYYVGAGEIYDSQATAEALAEISSSTSSCPTLTNGSPYQDFGTDASGQYSANYEVYLSTDYPETWNLWSGYPTTEGASGPIYWYEKLNGPAAFRNNGPSGGGA
jgi:hypothetical protein